MNLRWELEGERDLPRLRRKQVNYEGNYAKIRWMKKKVVMSRVVRGKFPDRSFDLEFWEKIGTAGKFEAAWEMVLELANWNPRYASQQRLRRTVSLLKHRPS